MSGAGPDLTVVPWADQDAAALRAEQQAGLAELYDGVEDIEPELPAEQMVRTVLVRVDGEPVATGSLRLEPHLPTGTGELKRMYVRPAWRGVGLSRQVLVALEGAAREVGLRRLVLETGLRQTAALGLYASAGYRRIPSWGPYVDEPGSVCLGRWLHDEDRTRVLVINGSLGAGKTTVGDRVGRLLADRGVPHVVLDVDALTSAAPVPPDDPFHQRLALDALARLAPLYRERGLRHVVLPRVVEEPADRADYERAFDGADVRVVRLSVPEDVRLDRLRTRATAPDPGELARTVELEAILRRAGADDAVVDGVGDVDRVAERVLDAAGW
ncbi:GNAT family N-acetyltransferase [Actinotalea sp. M2MS4P-6]|uniref:GNAT family N-acetyltransferase n=1 Tax=Actinotalea sp. M2MS4P-6 TaxID=2983762 RepID=UPI0021E47600|nr:GNAT family N-acetyltransferase [Actinotalea sp. M2MS4P-6]MCV2395301.1 GNAT family N-acetyltransferase [Actinotalea sp. M2MS4P-6]